MSILTTLGQYIPGSENYGHHEKNIAPAIIAQLAPKVIEEARKGKQAIVGGIKALSAVKGLRKEENAAALQQRDAQYNYENFDYNQDVGDINNPYDERVKKKTEYEQRNIDQAQANQLGFQQESGAFGATGAILQIQNKALEKSSEGIDKVRSAGLEYVEKQRQGRISDKMDIGKTLLGRADNRLAEAKRARAKNKEQLYKAIGAGAEQGIDTYQANRAKNKEFRDLNKQQNTRGQIKTVNSVVPQPGFNTELPSAQLPTIPGLGG